MGKGDVDGAFNGTRGGKPFREALKARFNGSPGDIIRLGYRMTKIGVDGKASSERHLTNHGQPNKHSNPHDHIITWDADGHPQFGDPINYKQNNVPKFD